MFVARNTMSGIFRSEKECGEERLVCKTRRKNRSRRGKKQSPGVSLRVHVPRFFFANEKGR